jgi:hypothetical protein
MANLVFHLLGAVWAIVVLRAARPRDLLFRGRKSP